MPQGPNGQANDGMIPMGGPMPQPGPTPPTERNPEEKQKTEINKLLEEVNIAESLDKVKLKKIGSDVYDGYMRDLRSKEAWDKQVDTWVKLAAQIKEEKSFPWPKASNIKYPLLATAAMQFAARAYPSLIPADGKVVQFRVVGADPSGVKAAKADKLAKHMNFQLMEEMNDWEEEMDRLLIQLPIVGCLFKKTYFDPILKQNASKLLGPKDLVVNYWASSLDSAYRVTEICPMTKNELRSMQLAKIYLDIDLGDPRNQPALPNKSDVHGNSPASEQDDATPYVILEQHTYLDLDEDDYKEPYIITIDEQTKKVLRIVARFDSDGIHLNDDKDIVQIDPVSYYTKYGFIPNPDGGFYDIGFGHLLGPLNESANTVINQLVDAGTLANLQSGFLGKGLRLKMGETRFQPGEWKSVNATGDDIKKQVFPMPVREPSEVLFKLLGMLLESGRELASVAEIFTGKMPGQNTPATTTNTAVEQGMKVFTAIYKRVYRAYTKEFKKLFRLNSLYDENFERAQLVLDEPITKEDYDVKTYDVCPTADPTAVSTTQKLQKNQALLQLLPLGTINVMEATKRALEAQEQPNVAALMQQPPPPPPDPKIEAMKMKGQQDQQKAQMDQAAAQQKIQMEKESAALEQAQAQFEMQLEQQKAMMDQKYMAMEKTQEMQMKEMEAKQQARHTEMLNRIEMMTEMRSHQQEMQHGKETHDQKLKQQKELADAKLKPGSVGSVGKK
jgi:chaperonin GroES